MPEIDAEQAHADGVLRKVVVGAVRKVRRGEADMRADVSTPLARLGAKLIAAGQTDEANRLLAHAVHDGVDPAELAAAFVAHGAETVKAVPVDPAPVDDVPVDPVPVDPRRLP